MKINTVMLILITVNCLSAQLIGAVQNCKTSFIFSELSQKLTVKSLTFKNQSIHDLILSRDGKLAAAIVNHGVVLYDVTKDLVLRVKLASNSRRSIVAKSIAFTEENILIVSSQVGGKKSPEGLMQFYGYDGKSVVQNKSLDLNCYMKSMTALSQGKVLVLTSENSIAEVDLFTLKVLVIDSSNYFYNRFLPPTPANEPGIYYTAAMYNGDAIVLANLSTGAIVKNFSFRKAEGRSPIDLQSINYLPTTQRFLLLFGNGSVSLLEKDGTPVYEFYDPLTDDVALPKKESEIFRISLANDEDSAVVTNWLTGDVSLFSVSQRKKIIDLPQRQKKSLAIFGLDKNEILFFASGDVYIPRSQP